MATIAGILIIIILVVLLSNQNKDLKCLLLMQAVILKESPEWEHYYSLFLEDWNMRGRPSGELPINGVMIDRERHARLVEKALSLLERIKDD